MGWKDANFAPRKCKWCGKEFVPTCHKNVYCSQMCAYEQSKENQKSSRLIANRKAKEHEVRIRNNQEKIVNIAKEAKAHGMSYGQYVAMMYAKG